MPEYQIDEAGFRMAEVCKVGKGGSVVIPAQLRRRFGIEEGSVVLMEERRDGVLVRPAAEVYTPERRAAFLLENATDSEDYARAREEVQRLGLDPDSVLHEKPE